MVEILFEDLEFFFQKESETALLEQIFKNCTRYLKIFCEAIDNILPKANIQLKDDESDAVEDILMNQRFVNNQNDTNTKTQKVLPPELTRR